MQPFDGPTYRGGRILAHAAPPPHGIVHFDDEENFTFNTTRGIKMTLSLPLTIHLCLSLITYERND